MDGNFGTLVRLEVPRFGDRGWRDAGGLFGAEVAAHGQAAFSEGLKLRLDC